jgi:hypothetical protein
VLSKPQTHYLIWIDILGFEKVAKILSNKSGVDERKVRMDFINLINQRIFELETSGDIIGKNYGERDDWLLVTKSIDSLFTIILNLVELDTQYKHQKKIPLEIAIDICDFDESASLQDNMLIREPCVIKFLKTNIVTSFRNWYFQKESKSIKSTFIVLTEEAYNQLDALDKKLCRKIQPENKKRLFLAEIKSVIQRGRLLKFLEEVQKSSKSSYRRIDKIFVPPNEYKSALKQLETNGILFIVGDPEIGKTYLAVRLLWEHYNIGFKPIWYPGSEYEERKSIRKMIIDVELPNKSIIYFEDPFGKTKFEDREELRRMIGMFIEKVRRSNARVIITSRDEVFKEFNEAKLSTADLQSLKVQMYLMTPSYTEEKMDKLLYLWAEEYGCEWLKNKPLKSLVAIVARNNLATPLSYQDFAFASKNLVEIDELQRLAVTKSREVREAFAEEISEMPQQKILFLSLFLFFGRLDRNIIAELYNKLCKRLELNSEEYPFEYLLEWFFPKIVHNDIHDLFEFTHPSYEEGVVRSWSMRKVESFFIRTINLLVEEKNPRVRGWVGFFLTMNYQEISSEAQEIIYKIRSDKKANARKAIVDATKANFINLPINVAIENLEIIVKDKNRYIRSVGMDIIADNFNRIPRRKSLLIISNGITDKAAYVRLNAVRAVYFLAEMLPKKLVLNAFKCNEELTNFSNWYISYISSIFLFNFQKKLEEMKLISVR